MVTVADCERVQTNWYRTRAEVLGGQVWTDGPLTWVDGPDGQNLMFPRHIPRDALRRGVDRARETRTSSIGVWLGLDVDTDPLAELGFERGWSPWWMTAPIETTPQDPRITLRDHSDDYDGEYADYARELELVRQRPQRTWYAAAHTSGAFAGHAWSFVDNELAGVFDMAVWPRFRRQGLGTGLLHAVCAAARAAGAWHAVMNATPEGKLLYASQGFTQIGEGITWWLHLR